MTAFDGQKQRNALTAAEQALRALAAGQSDRAVKNAAKAVDLDQIGAYVGFDDAVARGVADIAASGAVTSTGWDVLGTALGPGPLAFLVDELRGGTGDG